MMVVVALLLAALPSMMFTACALEALGSAGGTPLTIASTEGHPRSSVLCQDAEATLKQIEHVLDTCKVPLSSWTDSNFPRGTPHEEVKPMASTSTSNGVLLDLSSLQRLMLAAGCRNQPQRNASAGTGVRSPPTPPTPLRRQQLRRLHSSPPSGGVSSLPGSSPSSPSSSTRRPHHQSHVAPPALSTPATTRKRRALQTFSLVEPRVCTLSQVLGSECKGAASTNGSLVITFDHAATANRSTANTAPTFPPSAAAAAHLQSIATTVTKLTVNGRVQQHLLQWLLANGNWSTCEWLILEGLEFSTFHMRTLNPFSGMTRLHVQNSEPLRAVDTQSFAHASQVLHLQLSNNSLMGLPTAALADMTNLQVLDMPFNLLSAITDTMFRGLSSLRELYLYNNLVSRVDEAAFSSLTSLRTLILAINDITSLPPRLFYSLTQLTALQLQHNPITELHPDAFQHLTLLQHLNAQDLALTELSPSLFRATSQLLTLALSNNFLQALPASVFAGLSTLQRLVLSSNAITALPSTVFRDLTSVNLLDLNNNKLTALPPGLLDSCEELASLACNSNDLTSLPPNLFDNTPHLFQLSIADNSLRDIDRALAPLTSVVVLDLERNQLTSWRLSTPYHNLRRLFLNHNPMSTLPDLVMLPQLLEFRLTGHRITTLDLTPAIHLPFVTLELDAAPDVSSIAVINTKGDGVLEDTSSTDNSTYISDGYSSNSATRAFAARLKALSLENVDAQQVLATLSETRQLELQDLRLGWPGADDQTLPMSLVCSLLASRVRELRLTRAGYKTLEVCADKQFRSVVLANNHRLTSVTLHNSLHQLDVSGCERLTHISAPDIDVLDVSGTRVQPTNAFCARWGRQVLFARGLDDTHIDTQQAITALGACLEYTDVVDVSNNAWLNTPGSMNRAFGEKVVLSSEAHVTANAAPIASRTAPPVLQLTDAPVECALAMNARDLRLLHDVSVVTREVVYSFHCTCARGFKMVDGTRCVVDNPDVAGIAAGSVIGGLALGLLMAWLSRRYRGMTKRIDLQEQLLVERDEEVMALKKAWEIEYDELRMIKRVAAGAFGVVFKAQWETVTVAVKVLQQAVMAFDESTVLEFEKEVEFLQRTRHPHVVRFFGAGTDPNGSPFLVLEFVALGSLKDLLGKDMGEVLMEVRQRKVEESGGGVDDVSSVWDLKLRLLRDVASGMAFIHSLDQMHRDLKSGNVLVSSSLRAKITDFGSIRQCFTRGGRAHSSGHTRLSSSQADDDPQYSQHAGLQTMTSMTLTAGVGTPLYMAPEALTGDKYSFEADIFSFGVLMWEMATQRPPDLIEQEKGSGFRGPLLPAITELLMEGKRLKFDDMGGEFSIPEWFQSLTYNCMAQNPRERPSFGELKDHHLA
ncbi:TKL protein kinase [Salpingoeca rosetta]|uniref:TKL protein kinase n=1 Tax=Salpingoeca rosetta (strain ATCC 50818 / BSB-021) TaxID=946362 RepID=F2UPC2_SALR5|nr:TKL protein kinase [Salpingoeca rosetta]EGD79477.1 TKL protein kinase [Salpingoeca rosetta]|eukprot:XP_004988958.1 TKL protein kinase [Salpingoeca rosetta]